MYLINSRMDIYFQLIYNETYEYERKKKKDFIDDFDTSNGGNCIVCFHLWNSLWLSK